MQNARVLATGLRFPEGPTVMPDGSLVVTELIGKKLTRITPDGEVSTLAELGGSPNGCAIGPDGFLYVTNSGGFAHQDLGGFLVPQGPHHETQPDDYIGGRIQRVDPSTGEFTDLYTEVDGNTLKGPNDLVFDGAGGFFFTDHGKRRRRDEDRGGVYYAKADGSLVREIHFPVDAPNGIGLSPDGSRLYVAETHTGRLWAYDVTGEGEVDGANRQLVAGLPGFQLFDSLAVEAGGDVCVATIINGGISVISPSGDVEHVPAAGELFDPIVTNIAFGGDDMTTAYVTLSATGRVVACDWPRPGLRLAH